MDEQQVYRLHPISPLHLGERGIGLEETEETVHSDTLFSALCWGLLQVEGAGWLEDWLEAFTSRPPFLITSTFPWAGDLRFYPRPRVRVAGEGGAEVLEGGASSARKRLKKTAYVSESLFRSLLAGESLQDELLEANFLPGGLWATAAEREGPLAGLDTLWAAPEPVPHVTLDRAGSASALYHVGEVRYDKGCGLWFAVRWRETAWREPLEKALSCLGEAGIGGERSSGRGQFEWESWVDAAVPRAPAGGSRAVTLSLYHPTAQEVEAGALEDASYRLKVRRGWIGSQAGQGWRGKGVRMLAEGSVLGRGGEAGHLVDVTPERFTAHRVYRYGLAFPVPLEAGDG